MATPRSLIIFPVIPGLKRRAGAKEHRPERREDLGHNRVISQGQEPGNEKGPRAPVPATRAVRLTRARQGLWDPLADDPTGVIHHGRRLELHRLHHIPNADLQRKCNHGGGFFSPAWLYLAHGIRALEHTLAGGEEAPHTETPETESPKQKTVSVFLFYLMILKSER